MIYVDNIQSLLYILHSFEFKNQTNIPFEFNQTGGCFAVGAVSTAKCCRYYVSAKK